MNKTPCLGSDITKNYKYYNSYNNYKINEMVVPPMVNTTISITQETKNALQQLGTKGETYDSIIKKLIVRYAWKKQDKDWNAILAKDEFIPLDEL
ncbi:MAG: hypothetical protein JW840_00040 [Candidatus Thermoplasmatota archaeon]|nr:hypothetical protein [Candidatus Thermoplasmatota archaeon]